MNGFRGSGLGRRVAAAAGLIVIVAILAGLLIVLGQFGLGRSATPTPEPTASPIAEVSLAPTDGPTATPFPTESPIPSPTASPTPTGKPAVVHPNLADLTWAGYGIGTGSATKCGVATTIWVIVKNRGYVTAPAGSIVFMRLTLGQLSAQFIPETTAAIAPGKTLRVSQSISLRSPCAGSSGTVFFRIDYNRIVTEISENNNERTFSFTAS